MTMRSPIPALGWVGIVRLGVVQAAIGAIGADEAAALALPEGSMGPKVEAGVAFLRAGGRIAGIGSLSDAARILRGEAGTRIRPA